MARKLIESYVDKRMNTHGNEEQKTTLVDYLFQVLMQPGTAAGATTEEAIFVCFKNGLFAHYLLNGVDRLALPSFPISFIHGDRDWVNSEGGEFIVRNIRA